MTHILILIIYIAFISLGLPDALLGSGWPAMHLEFGVPLSWAGVLSAIICLGTTISSLFAHKLTRRWGAGKVTAFSVALTALALLAFSFSNRFWMLCLWAIPYGLGAGGVDAALNHYVATHYASRHMSWLHCMWGVGASVGPYILSALLTGGGHWTGGYRLIGFLQVALSALLCLTLPLWKKEDLTQPEKQEKPCSLWQLQKLPGARSAILFFFCYCSLEQTAGLWASSYLNLFKGLDVEQAAAFGGVFFLGITIGRAVSGFLTLKLSDDQLVCIGFGILGLGLGLLFLPGAPVVAVLALILVGLGCAPMYPAMLHATPLRFGLVHSQGLMGLQMASSYVGTCFMPPLFGLLAQTISVALLPGYLLIILGLLLWSFLNLKNATRLKSV